MKIYTVFDPEWNTWGQLQQTIRYAEKCEEFIAQLRNEGINYKKFDHFDPYGAVVLLESGEFQHIPEKCEAFRLICFLQKHEALLQFPELLKAIKKLITL